MNEHIYPYTYIHWSVPDYLPRQSCNCHRIFDQGGFAVAFFFQLISIFPCNFSAVEAYSIVLFCTSKFTPSPWMIYLYVICSARHWYVYVYSYKMKIFQTELALIVVVWINYDIKINTPTDGILKLSCMINLGFSRKCARCIYERVLYTITITMTMNQSL